MTSNLMPMNEGMTDRILRVIVGAGLLTLVFAGPGRATAPGPTRERYPVRSSHT
jgi:hypothetical protein